MMTLPTDSEGRKGYPLLSGLLRYFPAACAGVARISRLGNDKHNPGEKMHHARGKSTDHGDCIVRHLVDIQDILAGIERGATSEIEVTAALAEANQLAWRALALSQELHERFGAPLAPGARLPCSPPMDPVWAKESAISNRMCHAYSNDGFQCARYEGHSGRHETDHRIW